MNSVLMCHAPIVIPQIAGARSVQCTNSTQAMRAAARWIADEKPEGIFLVTPHMVRMKHGFVIRTDLRCQGDFGDFGFDQLRVDFPGSPEMAERLAIAGRAAGIAFHLFPAVEAVPLRDLSDWPLDHGAMVPLWFLQEAGWQGQVVLIGFPGASDLNECARLGEVMTDAIRDTGEKWMLLASGDMSHRLSEDAPGGFDPRGSEFDQTVVEGLKKGRLDLALGVDPGLRERAGEDVLESLAVVAGALRGKQWKGPVRSYEGPFGVGYCIAEFHQEVRA